MSTHLLWVLYAAATAVAAADTHRNSSVLTSAMAVCLKAGGLCRKPKQGRSSTEDGHKQAVRLKAEGLYHKRPQGKIVSVTITRKAFAPGQRAWAAKAPKPHRTSLSSVLWGQGDWHLEGGSRTADHSVRPIEFANKRYCQVTVQKGKGQKANSFAKPQD